MTVATTADPTCVCGHVQSNHWWKFLPRVDNIPTRTDYGFCWNPDCPCMKFTERKEQP